MSLCEGATARITGLVSRADLNGKRVTLLSFDAGRWGVQLVDRNESIRVKPSNLVLYDADAERLSARLGRLSHGALADLAAAMARTSLSAQSLADTVLTKHDRVAERVFQSPDLVACLLSSFDIQQARVAMVCKVWEQGWKLNMEQRWNFVLCPAPLAEPAIDINAQRSTFLMAAPPSGAWLCCVYNNRMAKILDPAMRVRYSIDRLRNHLVQGVAAGEDRIYLSVGGNPDAASMVIAFTSHGEPTGVEFVFGNLTDEPVELALANDILYAVVVDHFTDVATTSRIIALNAHTLELQFQFGTDVFGPDISEPGRPTNAVGMAVAGEALYIGRAYSTSLQVFSLAGVHLRHISGDFQDPQQVLHCNGRLYLLEGVDECEIFEEDSSSEEELSISKRVFELSLQGETLQIWKAFTGELDPSCPFFRREFWIYGMCVMGDKLILRQGDSDTKKLVALRL